MPELGGRLGGTMTDRLSRVGLGFVFGPGVEQRGPMDIKEESMTTPTDQTNE